MKPPDRATPNMFSTEAGAIIDARRLSREALARAAQTAAEHLPARAAQMARSPVARDPLASLALSAAADSLEQGRASAVLQPVLPDPGPSDDGRRAVRARVLGSGVLPTWDVRRSADDLERRHRPASATHADLSARLTAEAGLHERLWDDPRLPAADHVRLTMLSGIPHLLDRANILAANRPTQARLRAVDDRASDAARGAASSHWRGRRELAADPRFARRAAAAEPIAEG